MVIRAVCARTKIAGSSKNVNKPRYASNRFKFEAEACQMWFRCCTREGNYAQPPNRSHETHVCMSVRRTRNPTIDRNIDECLMMQEERNRLQMKYRVSLRLRPIIKRGSIFPNCDLNFKVCSAEWLKINSAQYPEICREFWRISWRFFPWFADTLDCC